MGPLDLLFKITYEVPDPICGVMYRESTNPNDPGSFIFQAGDGLYYHWNTQAMELRRFDVVKPWTGVEDFAQHLRSAGTRLGTKDWKRLEMVEVRHRNIPEYERRVEEQFKKRERAEGGYF